MSKDKDKTIIEFKNVTKKYKLYQNDKQRFLGLFFDRVPYQTNLANNDINFKINKGESVAILGRNGAGKSTLLKLVTGVIFPTEGEVIIDGRVSALLELTAGFDNELTGRDNIYLKGQLRGLKNHEIAAKEEEIIDFAEIGKYIDQPVRTYSSGMKARLGFSINTNIDPEILVVDEALSVGDINFGKKSKAKINELLTSDNVTVLFVTHSPSSALGMCNRGFVLDDGKLVKDSEIQESIDYYYELLDEKQ